MNEPEVRQLRAAIYGEISDESWAKVRGNWMKPENVEWLRNNQWKPSPPSQPSRDHNERNAQ